MRGDLYSLFDSTFEELNLQQNENFQIAVLKDKMKSMCKSSGGNKKIMEAFQDNMKKEAIDAGPIFCESLNGKLLEIPETLEELCKFCSSAKVEICSLVRLQFLQSGANNVNF